MRFQKTGAAASRRRAGWAAFRGWASALRMCPFSRSPKMMSRDGDVRVHVVHAKRTRASCFVCRSNFFPSTHHEEMMVGAAFVSGRRLGRASAIF